MQINSLGIIQNSPVLKPTDSVETALATLAIAQQPALPVVDAHDTLHGIAVLDELLQHKKNAKLTQIHLEKADIFVPQHIDLYHALHLFDTENLSILPVVDDNNLFLGYVTAQHLAAHFAKYFKNAASVLVLECNTDKCSVAEIARLAETNNCQILSLQLLPTPQNPDLTHATVALAQTDLTALAATYERFDYEVIYKQHQSVVPDLYQERYDALMNYLAV
jgi:predicted transcriptional regulator